MDVAHIRPPVRPDLYVVARFLDKLREANEGATHAKLQAAVRLNYDLYRSYHVLLVARGYVLIAIAKDGVERTHITPEGAAAHAKLVTWIRDAFGDVRL